jgi:hypothetical protein
LTAHARKRAQHLAGHVASIQPLESFIVNFFSRVSRAATLDAEERHGYNPCTSILSFFTANVVSIIPYVFQRTKFMDYLQHALFTPLAKILEPGIIDHHFHQFYEKINDVVPPSHDPIGNAIIFKLSVLNFCMKAALTITTSEVPHVLRCIMAVVDSHLVLVNAARFVPTVFTSSRSLPGECMLPFSFCMQQGLVPDVRFSFTPDDIPDLCILLPTALMFSNNKICNKMIIKNRHPEVMQSGLDVLYLLASILYRLMPHDYNLKTPTKIIKLLWHANPKAAGELVLKIIIAFLMDTYTNPQTEGAINFPFVVRRNIYLLFSQAVPAAEMEAILADENQIVVLYIFRAYYCELLSRTPGLHTIITKLQCWKAYDTYTKEGISILRKSAKSSQLQPARLIDFFETARAPIAIMHEEFRKLQHSNKLKYNIRQIYGICTARNYNSYERDEDLISRTRPGNEYMLPNPHPPDPGETFKQCVYALHTFQPRLDWFQCFGASAREVTMLHEAVFRNKPCMENTLNAITERTYQLFFWFCKHMLQKNIYREFRGDSYLHLCHANALQYKFPSTTNHIPAVAGNVQACDNCKSIKQASFYHADRNGDAKGFMLLTAEGKILCANRPLAPSWRELYRADNGMPAPAISHIKKRRVHTSTAIEHRKFAKKIATMATYNKCRTTLTRSLRSLGNLFSYDNVVHLSCYDDLKVIPKHAARYYGGKILCLECYRRHEYQDYINSLCEGENGAMKMCEYCNKMLLHVPVKDNDASHPMPANDCDFWTFYLLDDVSTTATLPTNEFREMRICKSHGPMGWVLSGGYFRKSHIIQGLNEKWDTVGSDGRHILCKKIF